MVAVVSAPGKRNNDDVKITDLLYKCNSMVQKNESCRPVFSKIAERYLDIARELDLNTDRITASLDEVRQRIDAGSGVDYAASRGEYLSALLISEYLGWEFIDAADYIVINSDGSVSPVTYERLANRMAHSIHYVVPGFYGATSSGAIKTFSRGGSDITGAIVARALRASLYENWTDVSGLYAANPRIIKDAKVVDEISYVQVRELSGVGASVFHEEAIAPVVFAEIPINIRNTNEPEAPGTMIKPRTNTSGLVGVSGKSGYNCLCLRKLMMFKRPGMRHALLTMLHLYGVRPSWSFFGLDSIVWFFEAGQATDSVLESMCERIKKDFELDEVSIKKGEAIIGLVGNIAKDSAPAINALAALKNAGIKVDYVNLGASECTTFIGVEEAECTRAVEEIYKAVF